MLVGLVLAIAAVGCATSTGEGPASDSATPDASQAGARDVANPGGTEDSSAADAAEPSNVEVQQVVAACRPAVDRTASFASALDQGQPDPSRVEGVAQAAERCVEATTRAHEALKRGESPGRAGDGVVTVRRLVRQVQDHMAELEGRSREAGASGPSEAAETAPDATARDLNQLAEDLEQQLRQLA